MAAERVFNFGAGPAVLPEPVLEEAQRQLLALPGAGMSVLEVSHRSAVMDEIIESAVADIRALAGLPDDYHVLFLQGGATQQFAMVPLNLLPPGGSADYVLTGVWATKAYEEAELLGSVRVAGSTAGERFARIPDNAELDLSDAAAYLHVTSNNTICGTRWRELPDGGGVPLVVDASSDIFSRPLAFDRLGLLYAGAQKNLGPAGVTLVIVRDDLVRRTPLRPAVPTMLRYATYADQGSRPNTPPGVRDLRRRSRGEVAARQRRPGGDGAPQRAQGGGRVRGDRPRRLLPGHGGARQPVADERHVPAAGRGAGAALPRRGPGRRAGRPQGAPVGGRHPGLALQRAAGGGRPRAGRVHDGVRADARIIAFHDRVWRFLSAIQRGPP